MKKKKKKQKKKNQKKQKKFSEIVQIRTPYKPEVGSFAQYKRFDGDKYHVVDWTYCRDVFHPKLYNLDIFFFSHNPNKGNCIASFMEKIEKKLGIDILSEYGPTQRKSIMWISPSKWWTIKSMRRSLFTILLRCGSEYSPKNNNLQEAFLSDSYVKSTRYAVNRFLSGHTEYVGNKKGWLEQFYDKKVNKIDIDSLLVLPYIK